MSRLALVVVVLLGLLVGHRTTSAQPPLGTLTVGADPAILGIVQQGVVGWNNTGVVSFVVVEGCGVGDVYFCIQPTQHPDAMAEWDFVQTSLIRVNPNLLHLFASGSVCHELGHFLGLRWYADGSVYHRSDGLSCMSVGPGKPDHPDSVDLASLGFAEVGPTGPEHPPVISLPKTGSGPGSW
jgi:hypothetical protein